MNKKRIATAAVATTAVGALVAVPLVALTAGPAFADKERNGSCSKGGTYEFSVDKENGGFEVDSEVDTRTAGVQWRITVKHDGKVATRVVRTTDREGEVSRDLWRKNTAGKDHFVLRAKNLSNGSVCSASITAR